ncbi:XdhC/CoxI family protein [Bosea sp. BK604]|uniref:XdhC family protein n=1 Tax=Bosea sp. BK604 TaxID=2512180 RepID=UPI00104C7D4E|nr:XdhC/CoxI family protein [Bosea sp. BK604]TCR60626.1 xanthine dehydrogenase accessory factor [Bosea sp. BK604]
MTAHVDVMDLIARLKANEEPFALATVVRTVSVTAAKAGAKAIIRPDGRIEAGWIGGGCARGTALKAAREALADGRPRLISVQPGDLLAEHGVSPGEDRDGVRFAQNMCPSQGTMDIFIEPVLPAPTLVVFGASPVALALVEQAKPLGFHVALAAPFAELAAMPEADRLFDGFAFEPPQGSQRFVVVSTQGKGDEAALKATLGFEADYRSFVGSRRKMAALRARLADEGVSKALLDTVKAPAGLDLGAITPEEIALSILAEIIRHRRSAQRLAADASRT